MTDFFVEDTGTSFTPVPAGIHTARCYRIIDLGTQKSEYEGQVKMSRKIKICWEVHGNDDEGNPIATNKLNVKKLMHLTFAQILFEH